MIENKLNTLFLSLTGVEKRACTIFLESPYFNPRADVLALWLLLLKEKWSDRDTARMYSEIYAGAAFDATQWRHLQSFLAQQIEQFLVQRSWEQAPVLADLHLAPVYRQKNLQKHLQHVFRRATLALERRHQDLPRHHEQYLLEWEKYAAEESGTRLRDTNLAAVAFALDIYLVGSKLRLACLMEAHQAVYNIDYNMRFLPQLLDYVPNSDLITVPVVALYYHCYMAIKYGAEVNFKAFKQVLEHQNVQLPVSERRTFLLLAINYCIRRMNSGAHAYAQEAFEMYQLGLQTGTLLENDLLSRYAFKNIATIALRLEAFDWTEAFIEQYAPLLEPRYRDAYRHYNLARLYYAQKNYDKAMPLLAQVDESDLLLNLDSRIMLVKMYFEMGEWNALEALIASFRLLLFRKKKVIGYHQAHYLQTLRFVHQLTRIKPNDKKALATFREKVTASPTVIERNWLVSMGERRG